MAAGAISDAIGGGSGGGEDSGAAPKNDLGVNPIEKWITWEQPQAKFFCGNTEYSQGLGAHGCGYRSCSGGTGDDCVDRMWVPPNQFVYMYSDFQRRAGELTLGGENYGNPKIGEGEVRLTDNNNIAHQNLCQTGYTHITSADFSCSDDNCKNRVADIARQDLDGCSNDCNMEVSELWRRYDPKPRQSKNFEAKYDCYKYPTVVPMWPPNGIYGPGYYKTLGDSGKFDDKIPRNITYPNRIGQKISGGSLDTTVVVPYKPWKDHLRECCFGDLDYELCGKFAKKKDDGSPNRDQGNSCSEFLSECTIEDIKIDSDGKPGKCNFFCEQNPQLCDNMKKEYCKKNPESTWCDCINADTRGEYITKKKQADEYKIAVPSKVCLMGRCTSGTDLSDIFITSDLIDDIQNSNQCPAPSVYQKVDVSGSQNVLDLQQTTNATFGAGDHTISSQDVDVSGHNIKATGVKQTKDINTQVSQKKDSKSDISSHSDVTTSKSEVRSSDTFFTPGMITLLAFIGFIFFGAIIGLIVYFARKKNTYPSYPVQNYNTSYRSF